jgi:hypothetical protein
MMVFSKDWIRIVDLDFLNGYNLFVFSKDRDGGFFKG